MKLFGWLRKDTEHKHSPAVREEEAKAPEQSDPEPKNDSGGSLFIESVSAPQDGNQQSGGISCAGTGLLPGSREGQGPRSYVYFKKRQAGGREWVLAAWTMDLQKRFGKEAPGRTALSFLARDFDGFDLGDAVAQQLRQGLDRVNGELFSRGKGGCSVVACVLSPENLYFWSLGAGCLYLKRGNAVFRLNTPQDALHDSYLEALRANKAARQYVRFPEKPGLATAWLGQKEQMEPDGLRRPFSLSGGDALLLCPARAAGPPDLPGIARFLEREEAGEIPGFHKEGEISKGAAEMALTVRIRV